MGKVILKLGIKRKPGYLYFVGKDGSPYETKMARGKKKGGGKKRVCKDKIVREKGFLYYIDGKGHICQAKMVRGAKKKKAAKKKKK